LLLSFGLTALLAVGCGDDGGSSDGDNDNGDTGDTGDTGDSGDSGDGTGTDASPPIENCTAEGAQCSNCVDDDGDMLVDGQDPECTGSLDNDEGSFATGIPGDNKDTKWQDCFFDGDSGAGNDKCRFHTCCILGTGDGEACPVDDRFKASRDCPAQTTECIEFCGGLTPPGCDCFGCCTICDPQNPDQCYNVYTNPAVAPNCSLDVIDDPTKCPTCTPNDECGTSCEGECVLCPGQTIDDLPKTCGPTNECPGSTPCGSDGDCVSGEYCLNSCCVNDVD
jgi:hypothetical protein